ncbi:DNA pilot protein [Microviridae sp.]|nr:DNA pilot protein [Microviridae sp.]
MCKTYAYIWRSWSDRSFLMSLLAAGASLVGSIMRNKAAKAASARQMAFQRDMSNTSYQRGMEDMKKAGLNPILAGKFGGASTPTGSTYNPENVATNATTAMMHYNQAEKTKYDARAAKYNDMFFRGKLPEGYVAPIQATNRVGNLAGSEIYEDFKNAAAEEGFSAKQFGKDILSFFKGNLLSKKLGKYQQSKRGLENLKKKLGIGIRLPNYNSGTKYYDIK